MTEKNMRIHRNESRLDSEESIAMNIRLLELMKKTSYRILQVNGQRRYGGPPPEWSGPPPPKDSEVFVGKIPRNCFEDELVPVFSKAGQIYELRLMMDFSGTNRGYAFVMYTCPEHAEKAVNLLNNYEIRPGRNIGVVRSTNNCKIYIGTISGNVDRKIIKQTIKYLTEGVVDVKIHVAPGARKRLNCSRKPHFVIAEYESHRAAAMARRRLLPARLELWGHDVSVEWANTIQKLSPSSPVQNVKPNGNQLKLVKKGTQKQKSQIPISPGDSKLINGKTLEQVMDEMLYGHSKSVTRNDGSTECSSSLGSASMHSGSESSSRTNVLDLSFDTDVHESSSPFFSSSDENFSQYSLDELLQYDINIGLVPKSYPLNQNTSSSICKTSSYCPSTLSFDSQLSDKFAQLHLNSNGKHLGCNNLENQFGSTLAHKGKKIQNAEENSSPLFGYPILNSVFTQNIVPSQLGLDSFQNLSYPFFHIICDKNGSQLENSIIN